MTDDDGDLRAVVLGAIQRLEGERDEALARAEAAEANAVGISVARAAEAERLEGEVASLRLTLGGRTFSDQPVPDPVGCPLPGACVQVAEITRLRAALEDIAEVQPASLVMSAWSEIDRLREIAKDALEGDKP